ncbi:MAG: hypothetical protein HWD57_20180 [Candidatus Accumulibacter cognatus]|uniref:Uncharacterized protein n=1 Tax=Candidatus Accumulibacter cognatus TaxID=2954383 RepID=A0A7D5N9K1_9PROT|nr:MAG: hypothetical protein HWD57_20180 [Candidatus Accumulibacter cognatus]
MVETDAHRVDHVMPQLSVRPWVLSVPKRVRDFLQNDPAVETMALPIFLRALEQGWRQCPSQAAAHRGRMPWPRELAPFVWAGNAPG